MEGLTLLVPFIVNAIVMGYKWVAGLNLVGNPSYKGILRLAAILLSLLGVVATSWLNGEPVDVDSITSLVKAFLETVVVFLAAHGSYSLVTKK